MSTTELRGVIHVLQGLLTEAVSVINTIEPESTEEKAMLDALVDRMCAAATPFCQKPALAAPVQEPRLPEFFAELEYNSPDWDVFACVYRRRADAAPELVHREHLPRQPAPVPLTPTVPKGVDCYHLPAFQIGWKAAEAAHGITKGGA